jgi:hypothetical protein
MQLTPEQTAFQNAPLAPLIKAVAYAGCGKTTSLAALSHAHADKRGLYLAFNKSVQMEAQSKFPANVTCKTGHGLAYARFGRRYAHKLTGGLRPSEVIRALGLAPDYLFARCVIDCVNGYCVSALGDFPTMAIAPDKTVKETPERSKLIAKTARDLWHRMVNPDDPVPMTHDGYLKLFQLSKPVLPYDFILFDEAQDANPVVTALVLDQPCSKVFCGDPYQSIYGFRGADDALKRIQTEHVYYLTHSFRFGPRVASIASALLREFFGETRPLVGHGFDTVVGNVDRDGPHAMLCRTNAQVFFEAAQASGRFARIGFVGGVNSYAFEKVLDAWRLSEGLFAEIKDPFLRDFDCFSDMQLYAEAAEDLECRMLVKTVETYADRIPALVTQIKACATDDLDRARFVLSTAHKAKGLDLPHVILADDFRPLVNAKGPIRDASELPPEDVRLMYVAVTRAVKTLQLNDVMHDFCSGTNTPVGDAHANGYLL